MVGIWILVRQTMMIENYTFIYLYIKNWILHESKITYLEVRRLRRLEHICYVKHHKPFSTNDPSSRAWTWIQVDLIKCQLQKTVNSVNVRKYIFILRYHFKRAFTSIYVKKDFKVYCFHSSTVFVCRKFVCHQLEMVRKIKKLYGRISKEFFHAFNYN